MKLHKRFVRLLVAAAISVAAFSAAAQRPRPNFDRPQTYDVQNYIIRASFERAAKRVIGDTTVSLKPLKAAFNMVELDAVGLDFESVKLEPSGIDLKYKATVNKVTVTLDKTYGPDDTISIRFKYTALPKKGIYFVAAADGHSDQIWTQGEPDEARHWFPSYDFPSDKATTEQYITADGGETVVGNGQLLDKTDNGNDTETWHYKMPVPHSTYLVSFVIGKYVRVDDKYKEVPLGFYVYPGKEETARKAFGDTKDMIRVFEQLTGVAFPYNKYDQTIVAKFQFGGMENITATTMADTEIFFADLGPDGFVTDLVSHELAHSWFGDLVTCRNWAELWLNEGFATYMEAVYREQKSGRGNYMEKVRADAAEFLVDDVINGRRHPLYNLRADKVNELFDNSSTTYKKGGVVLHTLREQVGVEDFWKGINIYLNRHKFASVGSADLRASMEEASGQDLGWFFEQWVYSGGAPSITVKPVYSSRTKSLTLTVTQTQKIDAITPPIFRLPLEIEIKTAAGDRTEKIDMTKRVQVFTFKIGGAPESLLVDPHGRVPLKRVELRPVMLTR